MSALSTSGTAGDLELITARELLRQTQAAHARVTAASVHPRLNSTLEPALQALQWRRKLEPTNDPGVVRRGLWKFEPAVELARIDLAEELIRRVDPGPDEDPNYLALLAYQAASAAMAEGRRTESSDLKWSRFLLGTLASREVNAFARILGQSGYVVVGINSALIDLIYQAAKSAVAATHPMRASDGKSDVRGDLSEEAIEAELNRDPEPVEHLYRTLEAYFYHGYPRAFPAQAVREENHPALDVLISMSERFVVAHEYGHRYTVDLDWEIVAVGSPDWTREFLADQHAMAALVLSGQTLDHFDPAVSLSGGVFSLACLDILGQGLSIVRVGKIPANQASATHPPPRTRAQKVVEGFHRLFHSEAREDGRGTEITRVMDPRQPMPTDPRVRKQISEGAFAYANVLLTIWKHVRSRLMQDYANQRPLHRMWSS